MQLVVATQLRPALDILVKRSGTPLIQLEVATLPGHALDMLEHTRRRLGAIGEQVSQNH